MNDKMRDWTLWAIEWAGAIILILFIAGLIFAVTTAHPYTARVPQLWTLWATDEHLVPVKPLLRFTRFDACVDASYRHGFTTGETATCLLYRIGDF